MKIALHVLAFLVLVVGGCTTVAPLPVQSLAVIAFDGGAQTGGVIDVLPGGGFVVTAHLRDRYNSLIAKYGNQFVPALVPDHGIARSDDRWTMTPEAMVDFITMNQWFRMGRETR